MRQVRREPHRLGQVGRQYSNTYWPKLLLVAAVLVGVGLLHTIAPDH